MKLLPPKNFRHVDLKNCLTCRYRQPDPTFIVKDRYYDNPTIVCLRDISKSLEHDPESTVCDRYQTTAKTCVGAI
jgi:hypothetical protein